MNKWFASYLTDHCQYVHFETNSSSRQVISCGVPQGSILGPLLYVIFVNDIHRSCDCNILSFACHLRMTLHFIYHITIIPHYIATHK